MFLLWKDRAVFTILSISSNVPKVKEILFNKYWLRTYHKSGTARGLCKEEVFVRWLRQSPLVSFPLTTSNYKHIMLRELRSIEYPAQWSSKFVPPTSSISIPGDGGGKPVGNAHSQAALLSIQNQYLTSRKWLNVLVSQFLKYKMGT